MALCGLSDSPLDRLVLQAAIDARAPSTVARSDRHWDEFGRWAVNAGFSPHPPIAVPVICRYIAALGLRGVNPAPRIQDLGQRHTDLGLQNPKHVQLVRLVLEGTIRQLGRQGALTSRPTRASYRPWYTRYLLAAMSTLGLWELAITANSSLKSRRDFRNLALVHTQAMCFMRRSAIVNLRVGDVTFFDDRVEIFQRSSKTDQRCRGRTHVFKDFGSIADLSRVLRHHLKVGGHAADPAAALFFPMRKKVLSATEMRVPLSRDTVGGIVRLMADRLHALPVKPEGLEPAGRFAGHSPRYGAAVSLAEANAPDNLTRARGGWAPESKKIFVYLAKARRPWTLAPPRLEAEVLLLRLDDGDLPIPR